MVNGSYSLNNNIVEVQAGIVLGMVEKVWLGIVLETS